MEFSLDETQTQLRDTVDRFCSDRFPLESIARREGRPIDRARWREMAELGLFSLLPAGAGDPSGGSLGVVEAVLAFEQLGSHLVPGPLLWSALGATLVGADTLGPPVSAGEAILGGLVAVAGGGDSPRVLEYPDDVDGVIVLREDRVELLGPDQLGHATRMQALDPLTPVAGVEPVGEGRVVGGAAEAARLRLLGTVLAAALCVGVAGRCQHVATEYAAQRHQFGVPIGSFQAVKHMLADMFVRGSLAQSAAYAAAAAVADGDPAGAAQAASSAKLLASGAALENAATAIQVLGGMGFTWDMLPNYLLKRAWVLENSFGTVDEHAGQLGEHVGATS